MRGHFRPFRLREIHPAESHRRFRAPYHRRDHPGRKTGHQAGKRPTDDVSGACAVPVAERDQECNVWPEKRARVPVSPLEAARSRALLAGADAHGGIRDSPGSRAVRRHETAHRAGPRPGSRPEGAADRRAVPRARRTDQDEALRRPAGDPGPHEKDDHLRHSRPAGSRLPGRPRRDIYPPPRQDSARDQGGPATAKGY